jgi:hypothetical protein
VAKPKEPINPFYVLVVILGVVFLITACGYGTMTYRAFAPGARGAEHPLMEFLDRYGMPVMAAELILLGAVTFGAMWLDGWRARQREAAQRDSSDAEQGPAMRHTSPE